MIKLKKIESEYALKCPCCSAPRFVATTDTGTVPGGGYWLADGDTIVGLYQALVSAGLEKEIPNEQYAYSKVNYDYELLVGDCPSCGTEYMVVEVGMIDDAVEVDEEFIDAYFMGNGNIPDPKYMIASCPERKMEWLTARHETSKGVALIHTLGPYDLKGQTMRGQYGVSACHGGGTGAKEAWVFARELLLGLWPDLKALAKEANSASR